MKNIKIKKFSVAVNTTTLPNYRTTALQLIFSKLNESES